MRNVNDPAAFAHRMVEADGLAIHYVDEGVGPLVILLHGFPYTWFEWRHQIAALAQAGFRVVAPDIRGFGQSGKPDQIEDYTILHSAGDVVALLAALGKDRAVLVGHDLGAWVAAAAARMRPDLFPALALVSTVVGPREPQMDADVARTLRGAYNAISGSVTDAERWRLLVMPGEPLLDTFPDPGSVPGWLGEQALAEYVSQYSNGGFAAPLAHYRCRDRNWELTAAWAGQPIVQPTLFIGGAADPALGVMQPLFDAMEAYYPNLVAKHLLDGVGHGAPEESPDTVSEGLVGFVQTVTGGK